MSIKCTYEDCFKSFPTREAMIKHKIKEPDHEYCKRCNTDCKDDLDYLLHQIQSPRHTCCPICGQEFLSTSGRDSHVEIQHPQKQNLECLGCHTKFTRASSLMAHIEKDECPVIRLEHFERQRAEKDIVKDAWAGALDSSGGSILPSKPAVSESTSTGGVSLLDDDHADVFGAGSLANSGLRTPLQPNVSGNYTAPKPLVVSMGALCLDKFPALLPPQSKKGSANNSQDDDLLDFNHPEQRISSKPRTIGAWNTPESVNRLHLSQMALNSGNANLGSGSQASGNMLKPNPSTIPEAAKPENQDPNAPHARIQTAEKIRTVSKVDPYTYFDSVRHKFVCPGQKCGGEFDTPKEFEDHLLTGVHTSGRTTCPSCLRRFNTTASLIAHCESANKRCNIRKSSNYNQVLRELTGGLVGTDGHLTDGSVRYVARSEQDW